MKAKNFLLAGLVCSGLLAGCAHDQARLQYPVSRTTNQVDVYHGVNVSDPYRWLEDDNSPETKAWVEAQNKITFDYLAKIPQRDAIKQRLTKLWNYERYGIPHKEGGRYFFSKNDGLQNQSVVYTLPTLDGSPSVLIDPNKLSVDGTVALSGLVPSHDGNLMAYGLSGAGSDWQEWKVRDIRIGQDMSDHVKWVKFSDASWTKDAKGFYYSRYDEPTESEKLTRVNYFHKLYYHRIGTPQSDDKLVYHRPDHKDWGFGGEVTDDGRYLIISASQGTAPQNRVFYQDLTQPESPVVELLNDFDALYEFVDNDGPIFWFRTDLNASRYRVIVIDITSPERANWRELIPQAAETLTGVNVLNDSFVCTYLKDAHSQVKVFSLDGKPLYEVALPGIGSVSGFGGKRKDTETFFSFTSYTTPGTVYRYDLNKRTSEVFRAPKVDFNPAEYETKQVFYASKDGTRVPMFITHKRGLKFDGNNPTLLYGYGGFNISITPSFSVANLVWMEMGGVYAVPNLRGGGEYGEDWHQGGMKLRKQNVFDDFIAAAEWLITNKYTSPKKLAISGGSNGGLLVGACETQRPDLFGACLPAVGVMDMLRFSKFTIGWAWTSDFGSPDNADEFKALHAYSPLHRLRPGTQYPATLITTADHDDRVVPAHSFKFAAALQSAHTGSAPALIRIETKAGHGAGKPTTKIIEEAADKMAFLTKALGMSPSLDTQDQFPLINEAQLRQPNVSAAEQAIRPRRTRRWLVFSVLAFTIVVAVWRLLFFNLGDSDEFKPAPMWDGKPRFEETTYSTTLWASPDSTLRQRMFIAYLNFRARHGKKNPEAWSFAPRPPQPCSIHGLLNKCMEITGTRYLMAYEASAGSVQFGHSNVLNGAQWVAAFEAALQTNQPDCFNYIAKRSQPENLLFIREKPGVVKVIPLSRLADYQKAGLVSPDYKPETIVSTNALAP